MLRELHISNLAVIEDAHVELADGLNCFTGQTGAGKSLIIGAFEVLLGLRSAGDLLRDGAEEGRVSGVFELRDAELIRTINTLTDTDLGTDGDGPEQLLITRKLFASGRTSVSINGQPATLAMLGQIGEHLVDVHGQHDHQYLLKPANQLLMLDRFAETEKLREQFADTHAELRELERRREELEASAALRDQQLELYEFQAAEIDDAEPTEGEYEELAARHRVLSNLEKIARDSAQVYAAIYESDGAAVERLQAMVGVMRDLAELDEELSGIADSLRSALAQLQDAAFELNRYQNRLDLDPAELAEIDSRLNTLNRLISKYGSGRGGTLEQVLEYRRRIGEDIARLRGESVDRQTIEQQIAPLRDKLLDLGRRLSQQRRAAAERLSPLVETQLADLGMAEAKLTVDLQTAEEPGEAPTGLDTIELLVQPNPGQTPRPLRKIASGGELSRIMLALKGILAHTDRISVLVFDEIDANVGGRMGSVIGGKLRHLAAHHQVLCITHLPQIAACADHHLKISKTVESGQTRTRVRVLNEEQQRAEEIADMLAGSSRSDTTLEQAREMLHRPPDAARSPQDATGRPGSRPRKRRASRKS